MIIDLCITCHCGQKLYWGQAHKDADSTIYGQTKPETLECDCGRDYAFQIAMAKRNMPGASIAKMFT